MSRQTEIDEVDTARTLGFGHRLKAVREEKELTIADISQQLRLDESTIQALETYDYDALPEPMFVCGYIRNYARFLGIESEPLVEFYKNDIQGNLIPKLDVINESRNVRSYHFGKLLPLFFLLIAFALVFAAWKGWQNYSSQADGPTIGRWLDSSDKSTEKETDSDSSEGDNLQDPNQLQLPKYHEEPLLPQINDSIDKEQAKPQPSEMPDDSLVPGQPALQSVNSTEPMTLTEPAGLISEPSSTTTTVSNTEAIPEPVMVQNTAIQDNKLILDFSSDCWVRIRDADGKILAKDLQKKGTQLQLHGKRPYKVFLGDATGVTVRINNTVFDHSAYINDKKIARFAVE